MIRKLIAIAALCLASTMVFSTVAMAGPAPDICVLDLSQPVTIDHALVTADLSCAIMADVSINGAGTSTGGDEDEAAGPLKLMLATIDPSGPRPHFDPGRQQT